LKNWSWIIFKRKFKVKIVNSCSDPPLGLVWQVTQGLHWIDAAHLEGIASIHLVDEMPEDLKNQKEGATVRGYYIFPAGESPPYIILSIRDIYRGIPAWLWWSTVPTLCINQTLAHEVAHHLAFTRGYVLKPGEFLNKEESLASKYAENVLKRMTKRWHYRLGRWFIKELAGWYFAFGLVDARKGRYRSAADRFYTTWSLHPEHRNAADYYWSTKNMAESEQKSQPSPGPDTRGKDISLI